MRTEFPLIKTFFPLCECDYREIMSSLHGNGFALCKDESVREMEMQNYFVPIMKG